MTLIPRLDFWLCRRTRTHSSQEVDHGMAELLGSIHEHPAEVVLLEVLPDVLQVIELGRGVSGQRKHQDLGADLSDLGAAGVGCRLGSVVPDQDDLPVGVLRAGPELLERPDEELRDDRPLSVREDEGSIRPAQGPPNAHAEILARRGNLLGLPATPVHARRDREKVEADAVSEPEFVRGTRLKHPLFNLRMAPWALRNATGSWRLRVVRLVRRQTMPWRRSRILTHLGLIRTPVLRIKYSDSRPAVHRVKAYPCRLGSPSAVLTSSRRYSGAALGRAPGCGRSERGCPPSQRLFQLKIVPRVTPMTRATLPTAWPSDSRSKAVARSETRLHRVRRRSLVSREYWEAVSLRAAVAGMVGLDFRTYHP